MLIREMDEEDIPTLAKLYKQFWDEDSREDLMQKEFIKIQDDPRYILLSALDNNQLVGSIMGVICNELYGDCKSFLLMEDLVVDQNCRRKGIGRALMTEMERQAIEHSCYQMIFITETDRTDTISFYKSLGFNASKYTGFKKSLLVR
ncbi:MAG: GNAT family N-acetyltransferase [Chitinispirillaceae bacterium]|nr:GNAT family N-acetyltransferase [Chitinispirillaceae bacterium]